MPCLITVLLWFILAKILVIMQSCKRYNSPVFLNIVILTHSIKRYHSVLHFHFQSAVLDKAKAFPLSIIFFYLPNSSRIPWNLNFNFSEFLWFDDFFTSGFLTQELYNYRIKTLQMGSKCKRHKKDWFW